MFPSTRAWFYSREETTVSAANGCKVSVSHIHFDAFITFSFPIMSLVNSYSQWLCDFHLWHPMPIATSHRDGSHLKEGYSTALDASFSNIKLNLKHVVPGTTRILSWLVPRQSRHHAPKTTRTLMQFAGTDEFIKKKPTKRRFMAASYWKTKSSIIKRQTKTKRIECKLVRRKEREKTWKEKRLAHLLD